MAGGDQTESFKPGKRASRLNRGKRAWIKVGRWNRTQGWREVSHICSKGAKVRPGGGNSGKGGKRGQKKKKKHRPKGK